MGSICADELISEVQAMASDTPNHTLQTAIECDRCKTSVDVTSYCLTCSGSLCDPCKQVHLNDGLLRRHRIVPWIDQEAIRARKFASEPCKHHPYHSYMTYCSKCRIPCCVECVEKNHQQHSFQSIASAANLAEKELKQYLQRLESDVRPQLKKSLNDISQDVDTYNESLDEAASGVRKKFTILRERLDSMEEDMSTEIEQMKLCDITEWEKMRAEIRKIENETEETITKCRSKLDNATDVALLLFIQECPKAELLQPPSKRGCPEMVHFQEAKFALSSAKEVVGELVRSDSKKASRDELASTPDYSFFDVQILKTHKIKAYSISVSKANSQIWVNNSEKPYFLALYTADFALKKKYSFDFKIFDMCPDKLGNIVGTIESQDRIVTISKRGDVSDLCRTGPLHPYGICINSKGEIVVGLGSRRESLIKLVIYDSAGSALVDEIVDNKYGESLFLEALHQVKQLTTGEYVVAEPARIVCVSSTQKEEKWVHKVPKPGLLIPCVYSLVCDRNDCVIYGDQRYDTVTILNPKGEIIRQLVTSTEGLHLPNSLAIDEDGILYITQAGKIQVVKYLKM